MSQANVSLLVLGVGAGMTQTCYGEPESSSALLVLVNGEPTLLLDCGFGTVQSCLKLAAGRLPPHLYVSHNHSDHAGELPVLLAVQAAAGAKMSLHAEAGVLHTLQEHRLNELRSTGQSLKHFAHFHAAQEGQAHHVAGGLELALHRSQHSERCFGFVLSHWGRPLLGWTADSGACPQLYQALAAAPVVLLDARRQEGQEHASFAQVREAVETGPLQGCQVHVLGYGRLQDAPSEADLGPLATAARPGQLIELSMVPRSVAGAATQQHALAAA